MRLPEAALGADAPINRLRALAGALEALAASPGCDARLRPMLTSFLAGLGRYDDLASTGLSLDKALGLAQSSPAPWWRQERIALRDRQLREIARRHYGGLDFSAAAAAILRDAALLGRQRNPAPGGAVADLALAVVHAPIPSSHKAIRKILVDCQT